MLTWVSAAVAVVGLLAKKKRTPTPTPDPLPTDFPGVDLGGPGFDASSAGFPVQFIVIFVIGLTVVGAIFYRNHQQRKARIAAFRALALRYQLTYTEDDVYGLLGMPFPLFDRGDGRGIENVLRGVVEGVHMDVFDYWYYEESTDTKGNTSRSYSRFDCVIASYDAEGAVLNIEEESFLTRLADAVALDDLRFESDEFNRAFNVTSPDKRFATSFIDARMMQWLLTNGRGYGFEIVGDRILVACDKVAPEELPVLMGRATGLIRQIPPVVRSLFPKSG